MSGDFSRIRLVAGREWSQRVRQRSFVVTTAVMIVVTFAFIVAPVMISAAFGEDETGAGTSRVVVLNQTGNTGVVAELNAFVAQADLDGQVTFAASDDGADAGALVRDDRADSVLTVTRGDDDALAFVYTSGNGLLDQTAAVVHSAAGELTLRDSLSRAGLDAEQARQIRTVPQVTMAAADVGAASVGDTEQGFRYGISYGSALIMYMVVLIYGMWVAQGVVEEKSSRIMEIMINAATPTDLMFGKIIGIGLAGLTQLLPLLAVAVLGLLSQQWLAEALDVTGINVTGIDFGAISLTWVAYFLVYFLLGYLLYGALYAGVGSLVSRQEDVQSVMTPMTMAMVLGFFGAIFTLSAPDSMLARVVSIVPLTSPLAMIPRILLGNPASWEIALSIALLALSAVLAVMLAARIYRMGVLMYGQKPSLRVIFRRDMISAAR